MPSPQPTPAAIYQDFLVPVLFVPWSEELLSRLGPQPGQRVLDVACGTGVVARLTAPLVGGTGRVVGLDPNLEMLAVARALPAPEGAAVEWVESGAEAMPLPDGAFDLVTCQQGLQFVPDKVAALREMRRVLAPGGRLGLAVWEPFDRNPFYGGLNAITERRTGEGYFVPGFSMRGAEQVRSLLEEAGWRDVVTESVERMVRAPSAATAVRLTVTAASAVEVEGEEAMSAAAFAELLAGVEADAAPLVARFADGEGITHPMTATVATAMA